VWKAVLAAKWGYLMGMMTMLHLILDDHEEGFECPLEVCPGVSFSILFESSARCVIIENVELFKVIRTPIERVRLHYTNMKKKI